MSPENQGVFQLLKEVTFRRIMTFFTAQLTAKSIRRQPSQKVRLQMVLHPQAPRILPCQMEG